MEKTERFSAEFMDTYLQLQAAMKEPGTLIPTMLALGRDHHVSQRNSKRRSSARTSKNDVMSKRAVAEIGTSEINQLTAFLVRESIQGVLLVRLGEYDTTLTSFLWCGLAGDVDYVCRFRKGIVAVLSDHVAALYGSKPSLQSNMCLQGVLRGLVGQLLFENSEEGGNELVQSFIKEKELKAKQYLAESGVKPSSFNTTPWSTKTAGDISMDLGIRLGRTL